ncbi:MAG: LysR family transcriptional regulator [Eubacterium sp.]|nr:LysR family transcriptional regulator [Eubacterium sp.]
MNDNQIKCFLEAATCLNFTTAARRLYITQPTLSRQIQNLEAELNAKLFDRVNNTTKLTAEGQALFEGLEPIYKDMNKLIRKVKSGKIGEQYFFNIGIAQELVPDSALSNAVKKLQKKYPNVTVNIDAYDYRELREGLTDGSLDMVQAVILNKKKMIPDFEAVIISKEEPYLAVPKEENYSESEMLTIENIESILEKYPLICVEPGNYDSYETDPLGVLMDNIGWRRSEPPEVRYVDVQNTIPYLVSAGLGVALVHYHSYVSVMKDVKMLPISLGHTYDIGISYNRSKSNLYVEEFVRYIKEEL